MILKIKRVRSNQDLPLPQYQTEGSSGMDLRADITDDITLKPFERKIIPTGISVAFSNEYELQIRPRSGLAFKKGLSIPNAPGTIDSDYRGEIGVILINLSQDDVTIQRADRIAQMVLCPVVKAQVQEVSEIEKTTRGEGGFGSTGTS